MVTKITSKDADMIVAYIKAGRKAELVYEIDGEVTMEINGFPAVSFEEGMKTLENFFESW